MFDQGTFPQGALLALIAVLLCGAGCSATNGRLLGPDDAEDQFGVVSISYLRSFAGSAVASTLHLRATAHLMRARHLASLQVDALLGLSTTDLEEVGVDECRLIDQGRILDEILASDQTDVDVQMLDAGVLTLHTPAGALELAPTYYPEVLPFLSGVTYGEVASLGTLDTIGGHRAVGAGSDEMGPFEVSIDGPPEVQIARLGSHGRARWATLPLPADRDRDLEVAWLPENGGELLIGLRWVQRGTAVVLLCRPRDDGDFAIPHQWLQAMPLAGRDLDAWLSLTRLRRAPFVASGLGKGELRVEVGEAVPIRLFGSRRGPGPMPGLPAVPE